MAGQRTIRTLITKMILDAREQVKGLKTVDVLWKATAKTAESSAAAIEKAAARAGAAMASLSSGAAMVRAAAGAAGAGASGAQPRGGRGRGGDPLDAAIRSANISSARGAGLAAGAAEINAATAALDKNASAAARARAKVSDLAAQVERNRKEMAALRVEIVRTGDADGTLTARMQGLAASTGRAQAQLGGARRELRALEGGLLSAIKAASTGRVTVQALGTALGNLATGAVTGGLSAVAGALGGSAKKAIDFESSMADVKKVLSDADLKNFDKLSEGVRKASREIGVMPEDVAALTASLAQSGIAGDELIKTTEDASKLAVAFGISGQESGQALAKLRTGLGLSRDEVNSLTGTINVLSNNLAATAPEITDAVQRVGSIGKAANLSGQTVAALATSMIASGANAEVAATGTKNFIRALGAGAAATKRQREAFTALGLSAEGTAAELVKGGKQAEAAIADVVSRIGKLRAEDRLPVLIELFGSESIGAIGPLATNIDLLTKSFNLAGDAAEAAGSVEKEFAARSATTDQAIKKLKANVADLAIQFGTALLPYINKIVAFLTSPEGQEWGRGAVAKAVEVVTSLATVLGKVADAFGWIIDKVGGTTTAVSLLGAAFLSLTGPIGLAAAAGVAMGAAVANALDAVVNRAQHAQDALLRLHNQAQAIRNAEQQQERDAQIAESDQATFEINQKKQAFDAAEAWYSREKKKRGGDKDGSLLKRRNAMEDALISGRYQPGTTFDERLAAFRREDDSTDGVLGLQGAKAKIKADKEAARRRGKHHKATKMDRALSALDPSLAGVLTQGGEADAGGDLKVHDDILSRGAFSRATGGSGSGGGSLGPGPNITTNIFNNNVSVSQAIDARSNAAASDNLRRAGDDAARRTGDVVFKGIERVASQRNAGGRMV